MAGTQVFTDTFSQELRPDLRRTSTRASTRWCGRGSWSRPTSATSAAGSTRAWCPTCDQVDGVAEAAGVVNGTDPHPGQVGQGHGRPQHRTAHAGAELDHRPRARTSGTSWTDDRPPAPTEVVLDKASARDGHYQVGDQVKLIAGQGHTQAFTLVGIAKFGQLDNYSGASAALLDTPTAQALVAEPGKFDYVALAADPGVSQSARCAGVDAAGLPPQTAGHHRRGVHQGEPGHLRAGHQHLQDGAGGLRPGVAVRRAPSSSTTPSRSSWPSAPARSRCCGPSAPGGGQVLGSIFGEALAVGVVASVLGVVAGVGLAIGLRDLLARGRAGPALDRAGHLDHHGGQLDRGRRGGDPGGRALPGPAGAPAWPPIAAMRQVAIDVSNRSRVRLLAGLRAHPRRPGRAVPGTVHRHRQPPAPRRRRRLPDLRRVWPCSGPASPDR